MIVLLGFCLIFLSFCIFLINIEAIPFAKKRINDFIERIWYLFSIGRSTGYRFILINCIRITRFIRPTLIRFNFVSMIIVIVATLSVAIYSGIGKVSESTFVESHYFVHRSSLQGNSLRTWHVNDQEQRSCIGLSSGRSFYLEKYFILKEQYNSFSKDLSKYYFLPFLVGVTLSIMIFYVISMISLIISLRATEFVLLNSARSRKSILIFFSLDLLLAIILPIMIYTIFIVLFSVLIGYIRVYTAFNVIHGDLNFFNMVFMTIVNDIDIISGNIIDIFLGGSNFDIIDGLRREYWYIVHIFFNTIKLLLYSFKSIIEFQFFNVYWYDATINWTIIFYSMYSLIYIFFAIFCILIRNSLWATALVVKVVEIAASRQGGAVSATMAAIGAILIHIFKK